MGNKIVVIGLDGATWSMMMPLIEQGRLPNIRVLMEEGAWGTLRSTVPPMTPLAWTSIATGVNPGKHGIYDFVIQNRETYRVAPVNCSSMQRPTIWDLFNAHGKKMGVVNFPLAFPPPEIETFFISGLGSPEDGVFAYPPELYTYLKSKSYRIHPRFGPKNGAKRYFDEIKDLTEIQCEIATELMREWEWDLFWIVFQGLDWIQHYLWNATVDGENAVRAFYCYMDSVVGRLLRETQDDWNIVVLSDHGFREIRAEIHLNNILEEWGYLKRAEEMPKGVAGRFREFALQGGRGLGRRLPFFLKRWAVQYMPQAIRSDLQKLDDKQGWLHTMIDWSQTKVFSYGYMGRVYIHEEGRYPQGIVAPGNDCESLREEIIARLKSLKDPETGKPIIGEVFCKEDVFTGDQLEGAPDILFNPLEFAYMIYGDFGETWFHQPQGRVADHDMDGILIMKGKDIRQGVKVNADVIDITPTLLYLHELPILGDMDGRVLQETLVEELVSEHQVQAMDVPELVGKPDYVYDEAEQRDIEKRLHELGYL